jgi:hypothetical protein
MASKTVSDTLTARLGAVFGQAGAITSAYNLPNQGQFMRSLGGQVVNMGDEFFDAARKGNQ